MHIFIRITIIINILFFNFITISYHTFIKLSFCAIRMDRFLDIYKTI